MLLHILSHVWVSLKSEDPQQPTRPVLYISKGHPEPPLPSPGPGISNINPRRRNFLSDLQLTFVPASALVSASSCLNRRPESRGRADWLEAT